MNKLNPIEDNIIEKDQSKQTPAKLELNNHQINRLKSGQILNNKKISFKFNEEKLQGYEGDPCSDCGNYTLVRNGTCMKCNTCGGTSGCS